MGGVLSSLNGFRVLMYLPDWAISVPSRKSKALPPSRVMSENICSRRVLTKFGLQGGSVSAIRKIGLLSQREYLISWRFFYLPMIGNVPPLKKWYLSLKHALTTSAQFTTLPTSQAKD